MSTTLFGFGFLHAFHYPFQHAESAVCLLAMASRKPVMGLQACQKQGGCSKVHCAKQAAMANISKLILTLYCLDAQTAQTCMLKGYAARLYLLCLTLSAMNSSLPCAGGGAAFMAAAVSIFWRVACKVFKTLSGTTQDRGNVWTSALWMRAESEAQRDSWWVVHSTKHTLMCCPILLQAAISLSTG